MAFADPRPSPYAATVVDADAALLAVLDAFDGAREKLLRQLCALHEEIEVQRASGALDVPAFVSALRATAPSARAPPTPSMSTATSPPRRFRRRELAAQAAAAKGKGTDAHAAHCRRTRCRATPFCASARTTASRDEVLPSGRASARGAGTCGYSFVAS